MAFLGPQPFLQLGCFGLDYFSCNELHNNAVVPMSINFKFKVTSPFYEGVAI